VIFALVDCNNFYVSCERIFRPALENKSVVVLSNNDGCIIARSEEAKKLGIKMGVPAFEITELIERNNVHVFSSNYTLYGDISQRVMTVLSQLASEIEIYSVDEAFLRIDGIKQYSPVEYAKNKGHYP
jgi:DNA polymerase V